MRMILGLVLALAMVPPVAAQTSRTGDQLDGTAVINRLDANDLKVGETHRFWFRAGDTALAQAWFVPVVVVKGAKPGPRLLLTAGIHGDELSGIAVLHRLAREMTPRSSADRWSWCRGSTPPASTIRRAASRRAAALAATI
ncbi:MAG: succinylglutamate desuccinylase/aspartoacylase family protein [Sphingopyxis sp.]|nr:succinylglutamate desuccinylase/aspartoacylase family protein [Sphingopyxis sp.]